MPYWMFIILFALMILLPKLKSIHLGGGAIHLDFGEGQGSLESKDNEQKRLNGQDHR